MIALQVWGILPKGLLRRVEHLCRQDSHLYKKLPGKVALTEGTPYNLAHSRYKALPDRANSLPV
jgi:hypothetical protein